MRGGNSSLPQRLRALADDVEMALQKETATVDSDYTAALWIDPARKSGRVCIYGTRIEAEMVAEYVWQGLMGELEDGYGVNDRQALCACWWYVDRYPTRKISKAWAEWADSAFRILWTGKALPEPPPAGAA